MKAESKKVYRELQKGRPRFRAHPASMIVGRDTEKLSPVEVAKAAWETEAENTSDGVAAPLFLSLIGGAPLGFCYKAINTLDSMIGYRNERYLSFGKVAAKLDDAANFIPARLCALLMIAAAFFTGLDGPGAFRIWKRDRKNHKSPNSAQTEAACAGALGVQLAGNAFYGGVLFEKPTIGDARRMVIPSDIRLANRLMAVTSLLSLTFFSLLKLLFLFLLHCREPYDQFCTRRDIYAYPDKLLDFSAKYQPRWGFRTAVKSALTASVDSWSGYPDPYCRKLKTAIAKTPYYPRIKYCMRQRGGELIYKVAQTLKPRGALVTRRLFSEYAARHFLWQDAKYLIICSTRRTAFA
jgi:cobalamin biosynthesis protein CobD